MTRRTAILCWALAFTVPAGAEPRIDAPQIQSDLNVSVADFGAKPDSPGCSWKTFTAALEECKNRQAAKLIIPKGRYYFNDPAILEKSGAHFPLTGLHDLIIEGNGAELVFHHIRPVMTFSECQRLIIRNLVIDWEIDLAIPGVVKEERDGVKVIKVPPEFPLSEEIKVGCVTEYDLKKYRWKLNPIEVYKPESVRQIRPQTLGSESFRPFPDGAGVVIRKYVYEAHAFVFNGPGTGNLSFEDITIYACPGMAFSGAYCDRGFRFSHCRIARREEPRRLISAMADGIWFGGAQGDILVENCDFSHQGDDSVNVHGAWLTIASHSDPRTVELAYKWGPCPPFVPGEEVKFCRASNLAELQRARVVHVARETPDSKTCQITLDRDLAEDVSLGDFVENMNRACGNFLIRNNHFHDHRARGLLIQAPNGIVENNRIANVMCAAMQLTSDAKYWHEGFACENVIVRGNTMEGCNYASWERHAYGRHMACLNLLADTQSGLSNAAVHRNILIENNTIKDTPGLAILIASSEGVIVRNNTIVDANTEPFQETGAAIGTPAQGSIMVTRANRVTLTGNTVSARRKTYDRGVYIDPKTTSAIVYDK